MQSLFIAFEGIDGSGKSTQMKRLQKHLIANGERVHSTCEPTSDDAGRLIRNIFKGNHISNPYSIAGLFLADRMEHILHPTQGILKFLADGYHVLSDRYYISSYAYHGAHVDMEWVINMNAVAVNHLKPHAHIFIDISPEMAMERIQKGRSSQELYETLDNLSIVRNKYFESFEKIALVEKIIIIDGNRDEDSVASEIYDIFLSLSTCS